MSASDAAIQKKMYGSGNTTLIMFNDDILLKEISKKIKNNTKKQEGVFLSMLLGTLGASLLGNLLTGRGLYRTGKGMYRARQGLKKINSI